MKLKDDLRKKKKVRKRMKENDERVKKYREAEKRDERGQDITMHT